MLIGWLLLASPCAAWSDEIVLRSAARVPAGAATLALKDVAELTGEYANSLGDVVVLQLAGPPRVIELSVQDIRAMLDKAGVHWGKINLHGGRVVIRPRVSSSVEAPIAMQAVSLHLPKSETREDARTNEHQLVSEFAHDRTVRGAIGRHIVKGLHMRPEDVKLAFDARDKELLDTADSAYRIEVEAVSSLRSDRIQMVVRLWSELRIAQNASMTVLPLVRTNAVVAAQDLSQGTKLTAAELALAEQWVSPSRSGWFTSIAELNDRVLERSVTKGDRISPKQLRKDVIIQRGDRAIVRCLIGGIVISMEVEARQEGAEGDMIEFRKLGERETFFATITAPGEAVMDLGAQP